MSFTKIPILFVHAEVVDLVEVVHHLQEYDQSLFA